MPEDADRVSQSLPVNAGSCPGDDHVPGEKAATVRVSAFLNSMPRWVLKIPCGLQRFLRSILIYHGRNDDPTCTGGATWPMPLPFPEVFRAGGNLVADAHLKRLTCLQVCTFDWLFLGMPDGAPRALRLGASLTARQWKAVRNLMHLSVDSNTPELVTAIDMGRAAAKVENFQDQVGALARAIDSLQGGFGPYGRMANTVPGVFEGDFRFGKLVGTVDVDLPQPAKPLVASRLHFTETPSFNPRPYFDDSTLELYDFPLSKGNDAADVPEPPLVRVRATREERVKLFRKMAECKMLEPLLPGTFPDKFRSGLFAVPKDESRDRMVLDARPANLLSKGQSKWCGAMASASTLSQIHLEDTEVLVCAGEDLKDYFYQFMVNGERTARNVLAGGLTLEEGRFVFGREVPDCDGVVEVGLSTLAMGDKCACEYAQCSHVSILLQHGVCAQDELLCLRNPLPRGLLQVGIIIDDLVVLEKILRSRFESDAFEAITLESSRRTASAREAYEKVGLRNNPKKGFEGSTSGKFWGIEIDGDKGFLRCAGSRMWPTMMITLRVASLGLATISLLESLAGSWVALLGVRRRMFSILDCIFDPLGAGANPKDVVRLSDAMKSELLSICILAPLAVVNLRAAYADFVSATDASSGCMAGVQAKVPVGVVTELSRHTLRQGVWTRLLPPEKAWLREHDLLAEDDELPAEGYRTHPLWEVMARFPCYVEKWRKLARRRVHINILELKAHLEEERRLCNSHNHLRVPFGLDSQVSLGAVVKGRASSKALNLQLKASMCYPIGADIYGMYMYFASASNRADGPTRDGDPAAPDLPEPAWWSELASGSTELFDVWMKKSGAPDPTEGVPLSEIAGQTVVSKEDMKTSSKLPRHVKREERKERTELAENFFTGSLSAEAMALLKTFKKEQFFVPAGFNGFHEAGALDLFSGSCGVAKRLVKHGCPWVLTFEWSRGSGENLLDNNLRRRIVKVLEMKLVKVMGAAPICSSFSVAITPPVRSRRYPRGIPGLRLSMRLKVQQGNSHNDFVKDLVELCLVLELFFWVENPDTSFWWQQRRWSDFRSPDSPYCFRLAFCRFGTPWKKMTRIATNTSLAGRRMLCRCGQHGHLQLRGMHPTRRIPWTLVAQPYPRGLNNLLALASCSAAAWCDEKKLNVAACAKVNAVVGEAANPGPRARRGWHSFSLEERPMLSAQTVAMESRLLSEFVAGALVQSRV